MSKSKKRAKATSPSARFRRQIHSQKDLRRGISKHRSELPLDHISTTIQQLSKQQLVSNALAPGAFPKHLSYFKPYRPLQRLKPNFEFVWNASVLAPFKQQLNEFLKLRDSFDFQYLVGNYAEASSILDNIFHVFGYSFWYIDSKFQILQKTKGLIAQKKYLENVIDNEKIAKVPAYISFFLSYTCEANVSLHDISREIAELETEGTSTLFLDYLRVHADPISITQVANPCGCLFWEENSPIIDRLHMFINMAQLEIIREDSPDYMRLAISIVKDISDKRIENMRNLLSDSLPEDVIAAQGADLRIFDLYTMDQVEACADQIGRQLSVSPSRADLIELYVRATSRCEVCPEPAAAGSLLSDAVQEMRNVYLLGGDTSASKLALHDIAKQSRRRPLSRQIAAFLAKDNSPVPDRKLNEEDAFWAMTANLSNPWHQQIISQLREDDQIAQAFEKRFPDSKTLKLFSILRLRPDNSQDAIISLELPKHRSLMYSGHSAILRGDIDDAIKLYQEALNIVGNEHNLYSARALYGAYWQKNNLVQCEKIIVESYFRNKNSHRLFPVGELLTACRDAAAELHGRFYFCLIAHIFYESYGNDFERDLSDSCEDILDICGVGVPSEINVSELDFPLEQTVFFLKNACAVRVLEDFPVFDTFEDIEVERIQILQKLSETDPDNSKLYSIEISKITREAEIAKFFKIYDSSRIYIDEVGIRKSIKNRVHDIYFRYKLLLLQPELKYKTEDIARKIRKIISSDEIDDKLTNFHLPATEKEGLFKNIYDAFLDAFVMHPDFGFKTYLSTSILHGALEGELRSSVTKRGLLFPYDSEESEALFNRFWVSKLGVMSVEQWHSMIALVDRFSRKLSDLILDLKDRVIRVRLSDTPEGLFWFEADESSVTELMERVTVDLSFDDFLDLMFQHCWSLMDHAISGVEKHLMGDFRDAALSEFELLRSSVDARFDKATVAHLLDEITQARIDFDNDLIRVKNWFSRATPSGQSSFKFDVAASVAATVVNNCYPRTALAPGIKSSLPGRFKGECLDGFVHILSNCLQNAVQHCGLRDRAPTISISASCEDGELAITIENELDKSIDIQVLMAKVDGYMSEATIGYDPLVVGDEGGSGLHKMQRSLRHDLGVTPEVKWKISEEPTFIVDIRMPFEEVCIASSPD